MSRAMYCSEIISLGVLIDLRRHFSPAIADETGLQTHATFASRASSLSRSHVKITGVTINT